LLPEELTDLVYEVIDKKCEMQKIELKKANAVTPQKLYGIEMR